MRGETTYTKLQAFSFLQEPDFPDKICVIMLGWLSLLLILFIPALFIWLGYQSDKHFNN